LRAREPGKSVGDEDAFKFVNPISTAKYEQCVAGSANVVALTKKYKVKSAFGTDPSRRCGTHRSRPSRWPLTTKLTCSSYRDLAIRIRGTWVSSRRERSPT